MINIQFNYISRLEIITIEKFIYGNVFFMNKNKINSR